MTLEQRAREVIGKWANIHNDDIEGEGYRGLLLAFTQALRDVREADAKVARAHAEKFPRDVFSDPPPGQHGQTVDACSARAMRHAARIIAEDIERQEG